MICVCGHSLDDHAQGAHRAYWFCEGGDCDCPDFEGATEEGREEQQDG